MQNFAKPCVDGCYVCLLDEVMVTPQTKAVGAIAWDGRKGKYNCTNSLASANASERTTTTTSSSCHGAERWSSCGYSMRSAVRIHEYNTTDLLLSSAAALLPRVIIISSIIGCSVTHTHTYGRFSSCRPPLYPFFSRVHADVWVDEK